MPGLRRFLRASPFLLGAAFAAIWLRRRERLERPALPPPGPALDPTSEARDAPVDRGPVGPDEPPQDPARQPTGRFDREPVDIVAVVDDLLDAPKR